MATAIASATQAQALRRPVWTVTARHMVGNVLVALTFFGAALPSARHFENGPANIIWVAGAIIMGVMSLVRFPPRAVMMNSPAFASTIAATVLPTLVRPALPSMGLVASIAIGLEICGVALSQVARIYMGRSFGILPGDRGIVTKGPFRIVRHPIYVGWFLLTVGYSLAYPSWINFLVAAAAAPFMIWRIFLEEELLLEDPEYREYVRRVRFRLIPGVF